MNSQPHGATDPEGGDSTSDTTPPLTEADMPRSLEEIDAALLRLMAETEDTVNRLRAELAERRQHAAQHAEIERLEHHLAEATVNWSKVKEFFEEVLRELTGRQAAATDEDAGRPDGSQSTGTEGR